MNDRQNRINDLVSPDMKDYRADDPFNAMRGILYACLAGAVLYLMVALLFSLTAFGAELSKGDLQREIAYSALHVADWGTTLDIVAHPDQYRELNPILGDHPTRGAVNTWMASTLAAHWAITYLMPERYRPIWQYVTIGLEGTVVAHNLSIGLHVNF